MLLLVQPGLDQWPGILQQCRLRLGSRVNSIRLHQIRYLGDVSQEKWHQRDILLALYVSKHLLEGTGVAYAVVGWDAHTEQHHVRTCIARLAHHCGKVLFHLRGWQSTQTIVAAQLNHHQLGLMFIEQRR